MDTSHSFRAEHGDGFPLTCDEEARSQPKALEGSVWSSEDTGSNDADEELDDGGGDSKPAAHLQLIPGETVPSTYGQSPVVWSQQTVDIHDQCGGCQSPTSSAPHQWDPRGQSPTSSAPHQWDPRGQSPTSSAPHQWDPRSTPELGANPSVAVTESLCPSVDDRQSGPRPSISQTQCSLNGDDASSDTAGSRQPAVLEVHFSESGLYDGSLTYEELGIQVKDEAQAGGQYQILASASVRTHAQEVREVCYSPAALRTHAQEVREVCYNSADELARVAEVFEEAAKSETYLVPYGIILYQMRRQLTIVNGCYDKAEYEELGPLGRGRQGQCVKARDLTSGFKFCIKKIDDTEYRPEEVKLMLKLTDVQGIVRIFGAMKKGRSVHILMELLDGMSLADWIKGRRLSRKVDQEEIALLLDIFKRILGLLLQLEDRMILHEDIKALNIMVLDVDGDKLMPYLIDFGAARYDPALKNDILRGTSTHFSPEKARSEGHSYSADVYAAVTTFINMLLGNVPLDDLSKDLQVIWKVGFHGPPFHKLPDWIPCNIRSLIDKGWADDLEHRGTASELLDEVSQVLLEGVDELNESQVLGLHEDCQSDTSSTTVVSPTTLGIRYKTQASELDDVAEDCEGYDGDVDDEDCDNDDEDQDHSPIDEEMPGIPPELQVPELLTLDQSGSEEVMDICAVTMEQEGRLDYEADDELEADD